MRKTIKTVIWITLLTLIFIVSFIVLNRTQKHKNPKICCNNKCFNIEIANNNESRQLWLMYRESLSNEDWMLFIFDNPWIYSFWMKNTLIPLAWLRIDSNFKIVDIIFMDPCKTEECPLYTPKSEAQYVLEINQWLIKEKQLLHIWEKCTIISD